VFTDGIFTQSGRSALFKRLIKQHTKVFGGYRREIGKQVKQDRGNLSTTTVKDGELKGDNNSRERLALQEHGDCPVPCMRFEGNGDSEGERAPYANAGGRLHPQEQEV
jgi:hypothetical protein